MKKLVSIILSLFLFNASLYAGIRPSLAPDLDQVGSGGGGGGITHSDKDMIVEAPSSTTDYLIWHPSSAVIITGVDCLVTGGTSAVVDIKECNANGGSCVSILSSTITCGTTNTTGTISDGAITSGNRVQVSIGTVTGTVPALSVHLDY